MSSFQGIAREHNQYTTLWEYVWFMENGEFCTEEQFQVLKKEADSAYWRFNELKLKQIMRLFENP